MAQTQSLVEARLPKCLSTLIIDYFGRSRRPSEAAKLGQWEFCLNHIHPRDYRAQIFRGACRHGHLAIAELAVANGANYWNLGLCHASRGGHLDIVHYVIAHGANRWNMALSNACYKMETKSISKYPEVIALLVAHGANKCIYCRKSAQSHLST